jgi:excinuclease ABC subunit A
MSHPSPRDYITIRGARQHNLKNINLTLPKRRIVVVTGPSGSGKSSLAFDTIFAEGQRRYMESLSSYARQFLERMDKPDVDLIAGLAPAIAIEQQSLSKNPRSTVATQTELYDHLRMLYAQIGKTISPISGRVVSRDTPRSVANTLQSTLPDGTRFLLAFPIPEYHRSWLGVDVLFERGFHRLILVHEKHLEFADPEKVRALAEEERINLDSALFLLDRLVVRQGNEQTTTRMADSVEAAFQEGDGYCSVIIPSPASKDSVESRLDFSGWLECDGMHFPSLAPNLFSFNSPLGACPSCNGHGRTKGAVQDLVIPDQSLTLGEGAVAPLEGEPIWYEFKEHMISFARDRGINIHTPYRDLSKVDKHLLWHGDGSYKGVFGFFKYLKEHLRRKAFRLHYNKFVAFGDCARCEGARLRKEALYVQIGGKNIGEIIKMTIREAKEFFDDLALTQHEQDVGGILLEEIRKRLRFLVDVGLDYVTLGRPSMSLSGGESQRIRLATALGSALVGALYVLDEPTIGLHPRDTLRLIRILERMRDLGNTVIVVEHDADVIRSANYIVDLGPESGTRGGKVIFDGSLDQMLQDNKSATGTYLSGRKQIPVPHERRKPNLTSKVEIKGAYVNNLKQLDVAFPVGLITCVSGVSGSGKSSLVQETLYKGLEHNLGEHHVDLDTTPYKSISIPSNLWHVRMVDQSPIGRSSRSNLVTYVKAFEIIRNIFAKTDQAQIHRYTPGHFSFNIPGGRCEECKGEGTIRVQMQFLADLYLPCEECDGTRYKESTLDVLYKGKNVYDVLNMSVDEALEFFNDSPRLCQLLMPFKTIGLGYVTLGQPSPTLSGGEAQRIKLASCIAHRVDRRTLYVFDEPTTGLHFVDIQKLIFAFQQLTNAGHTVVVVEHNLDMLKCADYIIDLGPEGGAEGGYIVAAGTPEEVAQVPESHTGRFLRPLLASRKVIA